VLLSPWNERFKKNDKKVLPYALPSMAADTISLVIGTFICAYWTTSTNGTTIHGPMNGIGKTKVCKLKNSFASIYLYFL